MRIYPMVSIMYEYGVSSKPFKSRHELVSVSFTCTSDVAVCFAAHQTLALGPRLKGSLKDREPANIALDIAMNADKY